MKKAQDEHLLMQTNQISVVAMRLGLCDKIEQQSKIIKQQIEKLTQIMSKHALLVSLIQLMLIVTFIITRFTPAYKPLSIFLAQTPFQSVLIFLMFPSSQKVKLY